MVEEDPRVFQFFFNGDEIGIRGSVELLGIPWGYIGMMEKNMETTPTKEDPTTL